MNKALGLAALTLTFFAMSCSSVDSFTDAQRSKCNAPLLMIVDRYRTADVDTTFTVSVQLRTAPTEAVSQQIKDCGASISTSSSTILFLRTSSRSIPCLSAIESVLRLEHSPVTSPAL